MDQLTILRGDCLKVLPTLPAASVQCCVTSPPYWGLRDYGTAIWEGGQGICNHDLTKKGQERIYLNGQGGSGKSCTSWQGGSRHATVHSGGECPKCGARRIDSQLGLESTPEEYVANMVGVFRAVWRVLRDDGTLWLNLGDSFQNKQLCGIPWRVAFALQADGWYLRSDIIWYKPNPMPESVTDRPTKAHEYLFLLTKAERYFYDAEAIKEERVCDREGKILGRGLQGYSIASAGPNGSPQRSQSGGYPSDNRNKRSVWTITTQPYSEAHFATFPEDLIKPCILAGSRSGDVVLDPFGGSGTTGKVAIEFGRRAVLIELNPDYVELARVRMDVTPGMF
jgi:DNA modification methylase